MGQLYKCLLLMAPFSEHRPFTIAYSGSLGQALGSASCGWNACGVLWWLLADLEPEQRDATNEITYS